MLGVFLWLLSGFAFSCGFLYLINVLDNESKIEISANIVLGLIAGTLFGIFTVIFSIMFGIMISSENKKVQAWFSKPIKTIKIKDDDNEL